MGGNRTLAIGCCVQVSVGFSMSCPSGTRLRIYGLRIGRPGQFRVHRHNSLIPFMVRLAHHERLGWVGSPRMGSWAGVPWSRSWFDRLTTNGGGESRSWFDWLTTNGGIGWVHHERLIWWAYHKRVGWVGSSGMGRLRGLTGQLTPRPVAAENRAPICCAGPTVELARPRRVFGCDPGT